MMPTLVKEQAPVPHHAISVHKPVKAPLYTLTL